MQCPQSYLPTGLHASGMQAGIIVETVITHLKRQRMKEITEEEASKLAEGGTEFPIIIKEEDDRTESAVALKKFPTGYVLGISCDTENIFKLFFSENLDEITKHCNKYLKTLRDRGNPFST